MSAQEIMRREWSRMPALAAGGKGAAISNLLALAFVAGLIPFEVGKAFLEPCWLIAFALLSVFMVASLITACFAGKEAQRDLRELAAGGSSGAAIALGKTAAAALRGWLLGMSVVLGGLVTVNLAYWPGHVLLPPPSVAAAALALSLTASWLVALTGALLSFRAPSATRAQDHLKIAIGLATLVVIDVVWFYPGDLLQVTHLPWIAAGAVLIIAGLVFQPLRKRVASESES